MDLFFKMTGNCLKILVGTFNNYFYYDKFCTSAVETEQYLDSFQVIKDTNYFDP